MGKAPAFMFYVMDWVIDLEAHPLDIEGAWIRIICMMWRSKTKGVLEKSLTQWSRILRTDEEDTVRILEYIRDEEIGNVAVSGDGSMTDADTKKKIRDRYLIDKHNLAMYK